jgi:hypothetical protein
MLDDLQQAVDLKDITSTITLDDKATIDMYYGDEIYPYYMNWAHNVMATHWQVRFAEIDFGEDTVLFAYKNVSFFAVKYYRLLFYPKSINGIRANEDAVYEEIIKHEKVTEVVTKEPHGKPFDHDFYINASDKFKEIDIGKYRSKHRINILKKCPEFVVRKAVTGDKNNIKKLLDHWKESKGKDYSGAVFKGFLKYYETWVECGDIEVIVMTYQELVIGLYVYVNTTNNNYYQIINVALNNQNFEMSDQLYLFGGVFRKILSDTSQISLYFTLEMLRDKVDTITFAGGRIPKLVAYKKRVYKDAIPYYRRKL